MALAVVLLDQATKQWAQQALQPGASAPLPVPWLQWTLVHNTGAAFGLFPQWTAGLIVVSLATCGLILWSLRRGRSPFPSAALALILGGAIGNLIDRARWGHVVDFIDLRVWPVFNLADSAITIGVAMVLWRMVGPASRSPEGGCSHGR